MPELIYLWFSFILGQVQRSNPVWTWTGPPEPVQARSVQGSVIWPNLNLRSVQGSQKLPKNQTELDFGSTTPNSVQSWILNSVSSPKSVHRWILNSPRAHPTSVQSNYWWAHWSVHSWLFSSYVIACNTKIFTEGSVKLFLEVVWQYEGLPYKVISDQGPRFAFTKKLNCLL